MVTLRQPLSLAECQLVREWRNDPAVLPMLRTGYKTAEQQEQFYREVICKQWTSPHLYYAIVNARPFHLVEGGDVTWTVPLFLGMGGLTHLDRKQGQAEISLILGPMWRGRGYGAAAVDALVAEAWRQGFTEVIGECYPSGNQRFWSAQLARMAAGTHGIATDGVLRWTWYAPELHEPGYGAGV